MKCEEVKYYLGDYLNGKLIDEMRRDIELHIIFCHSCKAKSEELKTALRSSGKRKKIPHGRDFWESVSDITENDSDIKLPDILFTRGRKDDPEYKIKSGKRFFRTKWIAIGAPLASILLAILLSVMYFSKVPAPFWQVDSLKGSPVIGGTKLNGSGTLPPGKWLKTNSESEARIKVGMIGNIDVAPGSEIQLVETNDKEYKLFLQEGKISAKTWAPPDLLKIKTPAGEVTDLGCAYTLEVADDSSSVLEVTTGWVAFKSGDDKFIIPAGAVCRTESHSGAGTPYFSNSSDEFKDALAKYNFQGNSDDELKSVLANASPHDALSLWYLLKRATEKQKKEIYSTLSRYIPPPDNVTLQGIMQNNNSMLFSWWQRLGCGSKSLWELSR